MLTAFAPQSDSLDIGDRSCWNGTDGADARDVRRYRGGDLVELD